MTSELNNLFRKELKKAQNELRNQKNIQAQELKELTNRAKEIRNLLAARKSGISTILATLKFNKKPSSVNSSNRRTILPPSPRSAHKFTNKK